MTCLRRWNYISVPFIIQKIDVHVTTMVFVKKMHFDNIIKKDSARNSILENLYLKW
jgi:hypothetical protein